MIIACLDLTTLALQEITTENQALLKNAIWIDLLSPSKAEEMLVETCLGLEIPTREEMVEIEVSSRLYKDNGNLFMTAIMIAQSDSDNPQFDPVTFVLTPTQLITIRYIEPQSFKLFTSHLKKLSTLHHDATTLFIELLDATVDRLADTLEFISFHLDKYSKTIFRPQDDNDDTKLDYRQLMQQLGTNGDLNTKTGESLVTFHRLITFFTQSTASKSEECQLRITTLANDIKALSDHTIFLSTKVNFLLDATLGMVNIEQNNIIKIVSVAAVIFLPPTLIASIYGMNFHYMPELSWKYGYLISVSLILLAAWLPFKYFKYRKWL